MNFNVNICRAILNTLPVGYYCQRRIEVELSETEKTSFYSLMDDKIVISYPIIAQGVNALPEDSDLETAVRSMLYHETSHAILTPNNIFENHAPAVYNILNIFEDERIETLLANFYRNVDFKAQLYAINGNPTTPTTNEQRFFNVVRFRYGKPEHVAEVDRIIKKYNYINRASLKYAVYSYCQEVHELYIRICDDSKDTSSSEETSNQSIPDSALITSDDDVKNPLTAEEVERLLQKTINDPLNLNYEERKKTDNFAKTLNILFTNFNKKNSGGSGINTYSGIFNPHAVTRKDYKYFERAIETNGNNKFGTLHLNLFLDKSGSFSDNQNLTNAIIKTLSEIEKKNHNFTLDVYFINHQFFHAKTIRDRVMKCCGGNEIPENMREIITKAQKPNTFNYNIFLFDGDALSDTSAVNRADCVKRFKLLDNKQTFIISDNENKRYVKNFTSAKVIFTDNYTQELITNLGRAFQIMLS